MSNENVIVKSLSTGQGIIEILETYCKHHQKFGVYISIPEIDFEVLSESEIDNCSNELLQACPPLKYLKENDYNQFFNIFMDGSGILLYDTEEAQQEAYWSIVGDDGPTETNPYSGPMTVYALTINRLGFSENENT